MAEYNGGYPDAHPEDLAGDLIERTDDTIALSASAREPRRAWVGWAILLAKLAVVALVVLFVWRTLSGSWNDLAERELTFRPLPALAACVAYFCGQLVLGNFWRQVLLSLGQPAPIGPSLGAYLLSQLGKYVPGKASVVLIRTERVLAAAKRTDMAGRVSKTAIAASVFYETLTLMAVGSLLSAVLTATSLDGDRMTIALALGLAVACLTPTVPPIFAWLLDRITAIGRRKTSEREPIVIQRPYRLVMLGGVSSVVTWTLMGVAVWFTAVSLNATAGLGLESLPLWVLAATLPAVAGFVSFLPAGLVVREALVLGLLEPILGEGNALAITVATRLLGVGTELVVCASLVLARVVRGQ